MDFDSANTTASRYILEEHKVIFPDIRVVNLAKCYVKLNERYDTAIEFIRILSKLIDSDENSGEHEKLLNHQIIKFMGEDWDLRIINKLDTIKEIKHD